MREKILALKAKAPQFKVTFDLPNAARTSNAVDRLMNYQDLNGFRYHENWLRNLMIAASLNGRDTDKPNEHKLI